MEKPRQPRTIREEFYLTEKLPWVMLDSRIQRMAQYTADLEMALHMSRAAMHRMRETLQEAQEMETATQKALESARIKAAVAINLFETLFAWDAVRGQPEEAQAMADLREAITMWRVQGVRV